MMSKLFAPGNDSLLTSAGLLVLRLWLGLTLLLNHGMSKLKNFDSMASGFADPFKIGHTASLSLVVFAEVVAAALVATGFLTRFAALVLVINMAVAFFMVHKLELTGAHSGELAFIYLGGLSPSYLQALAVFQSTNVSSVPAATVPRRNRNPNLEMKKLGLLSCSHGSGVAGQIPCFQESRGLPGTWPRVR